MNINATLFGQMITFAVFVWFTMRYVWPPILQAISTRQQEIADGLEVAKQAKGELEAVKQQVVAELQHAKQDANVIIETASKKSLVIIEDAKNKAREEGQRIVAAAKKEIDQEVVKARQGLQEEIAKITVLSLEKVINKQIDNATQERLVQEVINEIR